MTSLQQFVATQGVDDRLEESRVWAVLLDLLRAVKHLHDSDLIHFDIKLVRSVTDLRIYLGHFSSKISSNLSLPVG